MPRLKMGVEDRPRRTDGGLVDRLAEELKSDRKSGQPTIYEQLFPSDKLRVTVIWDDWDRLPLEDRTETILRAYDRAENPGYRARIALASGLTVPEAHAAGMLPFEIVTALRRGDPVTPEQCREALIAEGASILLNANRPHLMFATADEAEAARGRLIERLAGSDPVWMVTQAVGGVDDWSQR